MKLRDFKKRMQKTVFKTSEAHLVALNDNPNLLNLQLHQWKKQGELLSLKRGVFVVSDRKPPIQEIAKELYEPCYFSLEYALSFYGVIPEAVFSYTLVTPKATRIFKTYFGDFYYHSLKKAAFTGYDSETLMAEKEKALVDYFYLNSAKFEPNPQFWEEMRFNTTYIDFKKVFKFAKLFNSKKLFTLLTSFEDYAKSH